MQGEDNHFANLEIIENVNQLGDVVITGQVHPPSLRNDQDKVCVVNQKSIAQKAS